MEVDTFLTSRREKKQEAELVETQNVLNAGTKILLETLSFMYEDVQSARVGVGAFSEL
jgi:hypothetical protein